MKGEGKIKWKESLGKLPWGLIFLICVAMWAVIELIVSILYFF